MSNTGGAGAEIEAVVDAVAQILSIPLQYLAAEEGEGRTLYLAFMKDAERLKELYDREVEVVDDGGVVERKPLGRVVDEYMAALIADEDGMKGALAVTLYVVKRILERVERYAAGDK